MKKLVLAMLITIGASGHSGREALRLLGADGPAPERADKLMLFGQFVGDWEFSGVERHPDGSTTADKGEIHMAWVLKGRAIQDVWLERERSDSQPLTYGTTLRMYDPAADVWRITWMEPNYGVMRTLTGRAVAEGIEFDGEASDSTPVRWIFSEITRSSFRWRAERRAGDAWRIYEELTARRMK